MELNNQKIPHVLRSYHDSALDGIYQFSHGWGEVEAPTELKEEVLSILKDIREAEAEEVIVVFVDRAVEGVLYGDYGVVDLGGG